MIDEMFCKIEVGLNEGYKWIKIKIKLGWDFNLMCVVWYEFFFIFLMVDVNFVYMFVDVDYFV